MVVSFLIVLFVGVIVLGGTALWIWAIVDCATKEPDVGNTKIVWILIVVLAHFIGALIYIIVRRPERIAQIGQ